MADHIDSFFSIPRFTILCDFKQSTLVNREWDLSIQNIVPFIDGANYVKRIALLADMDVGVASEAVVSPLPPCSIFSPRSELLLLL